MSLLVRDQKHTFLGPSALDFVILNDELFLQDFDSIYLFRALRFCQHDFSKVTLTQDS